MPGSIKFHCDLDGTLTALDVLAGRAALYTHLPAHLPAPDSNLFLCSTCGTCLVGTCDHVLREYYANVGSYVHVACVALSRPLSATA